jgi:hypothetical protein
VTKEYFRRGSINRNRNKIKIKKEFDRNKLLEGKGCSSKSIIEDIG